jgi:plastocyanin
MRMKQALLLSALLLVSPAVALAAEGTPAAANPAVVEIRNMHFTPATLTIPAGTEVTWVNKDESPHTVTDTSLAFRSAALDTDEHFSHKFTAPGEFTYFCTIHPMMVGHITVTPARGPS